MQPRTDSTDSTLQTHAHTTGAPVVRTRMPKRRDARQLLTPLHSEATALGKKDVQLYPGNVRPARPPACLPAE